MEDVERSQQQEHDKIAEDDRKAPSRDARGREDRGRVKGGGRGRRQGSSRGSTLRMGCPL